MIFDFPNKQSNSRPSNTAFLFQLFDDIIAIRMMNPLQLTQYVIPSVEWP